jgi:hypothetical protein
MSCFEMDADGPKALQINILDVDGRRFEDDLKLRVLVEAVGILAIAAVGGPTAGLHIANAVSVRPEDAEKRFRMHSARANFHIVRLLQDATLLHPKMGELEYQILKRQTLFALFKFYFNFQAVSKSSRVTSRRSL